MTIAKKQGGESEGEEEARVRRIREKLKQKKQEERIKKKEAEEKKRKWAEDIAILGYPKWRRRELEMKEREDWERSGGEGEWEEEKERRNKAKENEKEVERLLNMSEIREGMQTWRMEERMIKRCSA